MRTCLSRIEQEALNASTKVYTPTGRGFVSVLCVRSPGGVEPPAWRVRSHGDVSGGVPPPHGRWADGKRCGRAHGGARRLRRQERREGVSRWRGGARREGLPRVWRQIVRTKAESQRIVATRPLCRVQYPVPYSSRLQVIHRPGSGNCDRSRLMQYGCAWLPPGGKKRVFRHGF